MGWYMRIRISAKNFSGFIGPYEFKENVTETKDIEVSKRFQNSARILGFSWAIEKPKRRTRKKKAD